MAKTLTVARFTAATVFVWLAPSPALEGSPVWPRMFFKPKDQAGCKSGKCEPERRFGRRRY